MSVSRLVIFDVDGTLVDSQGDIIESMNQAFAAHDATAPEREAILSIVGLSLDRAIWQLAPDLAADKRNDIEDTYKRTYRERRARKGSVESSPLFPGAEEALEALSCMEDVHLGIATGKSRRGLDRLLDGHGLRDAFVTTQVADDHPSKPHPSMVLAALADTGVEAPDCILVGDTSYDMQMARAGGVRALGASWGYHDVSRLCDADRIVSDFTEMMTTIKKLWGTP
jgi:phosphoglycolate phosphatase